MDGASRGNPAPSGFGVHLRLDTGEVIEVAGWLGVTTNNVAEYSGLIAKASRTDVETARIKTLEDLAKTNAPKLDTIVTELNKTVDTEQQDTDKKFTDKATDVISQVATERKIIMVVHPLAVIWYSPTIDITDEVIKRLNG